MVLQACWHLLKKLSELMKVRDLNSMETVMLP